MTMTRTMDYYIRTNGVPSGLRRDNAKEEQSAEVDAIHHELYIKDEFSEPYNQQQNPVECRAILYIKDHVHVLLNRTGALDAAWFHCAKYLCEIHSILSNKNLPNGMTSKRFRSGVTTDISPWLQFRFWQAILYLDNENELTPILLDTSLDPPFVPVEADQYAGKSLLRLSRDQLPIDPDIAHFPRHGKLPHSEIRYKRDYTPRNNLKKWRYFLKIRHLCSKLKNPSQQSTRNQPNVPLVAKRSNLSDLPAA